MWLIVGLGNPGDKYKNTRHNIGYRVVYFFANKHKIYNTSNKFKSIFAKTNLEGEKVLLAQPLTYMNRSGESVKKIVDYFHIPLDKVIIIYDDLDLPTGKIRIKEKGGAGGHKGLASVIEKLNSKDVPRIRIGIGRPKNNHFEISDYVLGHFSTEELKIIEDSVDKVVSVLEMIIKGNLAKAMNRFN